MANQYVIRVMCSVEGHDDDWVEFDTSAWGLADFREIYYASLADTLRRWVERDSVAWHITGPGGESIPHPGRGVDYPRWLAAYRQMGEEGLKLGRWLAASALLAIYERMENPKKSSAGSATDGDGGEGSGVARDSNGASG
jgi:hypothetical protein